MPNFLPKLDKRIQEKDPEDVHEDFRVWMTWTQGRLPTFSLLQRAIVLSCEPCRDIRYHNSNFLYNIPLKVLQKLFNENSILVVQTVKQQEFLQSILFLTLGYLQKVNHRHDTNYQLSNLVRYLSVDKSFPDFHGIAVRSCQTR